MGIVQKFGGTIIHGVYGFLNGAEMTSTSGNTIKFSSAARVGQVSTLSTSGNAGMIGVSTNGKLCWWSTASNCYIPLSS